MSSQMRSCSGRPSIIERYRELLSVDEQTPVISLQEGDTPLLRASNIESRFEKLTGRPAGFEIWLKYDGANPTGSFKDRGMTMAMSKAAQEGSKGVICASTGNTSASAAAFAATSAAAAPTAAASAAAISAAAFASASAAAFSRAARRS